MRNQVYMRWTTGTVLLSVALVPAVPAYGFQACIRTRLMSVFPQEYASLAWIMAVASILVTFVVIGLALLRELRPIPFGLLAALPPASLTLLHLWLTDAAEEIPGCYGSKLVKPILDMSIETDHCLTAVATYLVMALAFSLAFRASENGHGGRIAMYLTLLAISVFGTALVMSELTIGAGDGIGGW